MSLILGGQLWRSLATLATSSYLCCASTPAIRSVNFAGRDRPELADSCGSERSRRGIVSTPNPIVLVDSAGKVAARPLNDTVMLITISSGVAAPALIRPIYDADRRTASGLRPVGVAA